MVWKQEKQIVARRLESFGKSLKKEKYEEDLNRGGGADTDQEVGLLKSLRKI